MLLIETAYRLQISGPYQILGEKKLGGQFFQCITWDKLFVRDLFDIKIRMCGK